MDTDGVTVGAVRACRAIVAVPPALAGRIEYEPALPAARDQLTQRMPMGSVIKCMAVYEKPSGASGGSPAGGQPARSAQVIFDNTRRTAAPA